MTQLNNEQKSIKTDVSATLDFDTTPLTTKLDEIENQLDRILTKLEKVNELRGV
ncbi:hypothetical protein [Paenibacillus sp. BR1-192]|uniref:hypothetical protein n=1 Tax=Paenibacillus sp. BR1-192 TaxID=3032287 RepID=UPI00240D982E|nr:hypothetical protein [Paenibacillus sp. BR1-192]WFB60537.1 hypothetical protein P0X86_10175 [Paenibacillus sp. BR1-192]